MGWDRVEVCLVRRAQGQSTRSGGFKRWAGRIALFLLSHQGAAGHSVLPGASDTVGILTRNRVQETTHQRMEEGIIQELIFFCL